MSSNRHLNQRSMLWVAICLFAFIIIAALVTAIYFYINERRPILEFNEAIAAVTTQDLPKLQSMIQTNPSLVHRTDSFEGMTLLHIAANQEKPSIAVITLLLNENANINATDTLGRTPLHLMCQGCSDMTAIDFIIQNGANLDIQDGTGRTPRDMASNNPYRDKVINTLDWYP